MKKVVSVNLGNFGSTGGIMRGISKTAQSKGYETYNAYPGGVLNKTANDNDIKLGNELFKKINQKLAYYTGLNGCFAVITTYRFLKKLDNLRPDILHFHNLHNSFLNLPMLFRYVKKNNIKIIWTLHDCWAFTGKCPYMDMVGCDKWETACHNCSQYKSYPESRIDTTKWLFNKKKKWFLGVQDMTIVTPSAWLGKLVEKSFLKDYDVRVINNGIDLSVFRPMESDLRKKLGLENKKVVLGCASPWSERKGFDVFLELSEKLCDDYRIVLVGVSQKQKSALPKNIIGIERTSNQKELAELYSMADVFVNPTREENFPTVNIESLACGTPVVTFNTGGSPEIIDETCGLVTKTKDAKGILDSLQAIENGDFSKDACLKRAGIYNMNDKFLEYVRLYEEN